jgi:hypothetical protein
MLTHHDKLELLSALLDAHYQGEQRLGTLAELAALDHPEGICTVTLSTTLLYKLLTQDSSDAA